MKIYKFKDTTDGNLAYILAPTHAMAVAKMDSLTALKFVYVAELDVDNLDKPIVIMNKILPF